MALGVDALFAKKRLGSGYGVLAAEDPNDFAMPDRTARPMPSDSSSSMPRTGEAEKFDFAKYQTPLEDPNKILAGLSALMGMTRKDPFGGWNESIEYQRGSAQRDRREELHSDLASFLKGREMTPAEGASLYEAEHYLGNMSATRPPQARQPNQQSVFDQRIARQSPAMRQRFDDMSDAELINMIEMSEIGIAEQDEKSIIASGRLPNRPADKYSYESLAAFRESFLPTINDTPEDAAENRKRHQRLDRLRRERGLPPAPPPSGVEAEIDALGAPDSGSSYLPPEAAPSSVPSPFEAESAREAGQAVIPWMADAAMGNNPVDRYLAGQVSGAMDWWEKNARFGTPESVRHGTQYLTRPDPDEEAAREAANKPLEEFIGGIGDFAMPSVKGLSDVGQHPTSPSAMSGLDQLEGMDARDLQLTLLGYDVANMTDEEKRAAYRDHGL